MMKQKMSLCIVGMMFLTACTFLNDQGPSATSETATSTVAPTVQPTAMAVTTEDIAVKPIDWHACDDEQVTEPGFECATVYVPLDYADPTGTKLEIAVIRYKAQSERKGAILYNPGGPGASGFDMVAWMGTYYVGELGLDEFDFVGFDPRGVERSNGIKCQSDAEIDKYQFGDSSPDTPEEEAFFDEANAAFVDACNAKYGNSLQHYSTANTARDMDVIRAAMGDDQISYLGVSYGTYLGAVYANLFPDRVRTMVLDSAFEPNDDSIEEQYTTQLLGFERAMNNWIAWCESETTCAFHADDVGARWDALYEQYNQQPVTAADGRVTYQGAILRATKAALYAESSWGQLAQALADAEKGNVTEVWKLVDGYYERDENGQYTSMVHSFDIITCASGFEYDEVPDPAALLATIQQIAPRMSVDMRVEDFEGESGCEELMPIQSATPVGYTGDAPILVIGGENDPATPMRWSEKMRERMGPRAVLLKYTGEGHGQVLSATCVNTAASDVLVSLTLPTDGTVCQPDAEVSEPSWWANVPRAEQGEQFISRDQLATDIGITKNDAYATGLIMVGTTEELMTRMHQRLELRGVIRMDDIVTMDGGAQIADYFVGGDSLRVLVVGSELVANGDWDYLQSVIPENHGIVVFLAIP